MERKFIWAGLIVGSAAGNFVPLLWGGSAMSMSGMLFAFLGGMVGIGVGYKAGNWLQ